MVLPRYAGSVDHPVTTTGMDDGAVANEPDLSIPDGANEVIAPSDVMSTDVLDLMTPTGIVVDVDVMSTVVVPTKLVVGMDTTSDLMSTIVCMRATATGLPMVAAEPI